MSRQQQVVLLIALLVIGGVVWGWQYWPSAGNGANGTAAFLQGYHTLNFPESRLHEEVIELRRKSEYKGTGRNPFSMIVPPSPEDVKRAEDEAKKIADAHKNDPPLPPPALELPPNMKFFGYGNVPNGTPRRAFLSYQDDVYIVSEGDMLMGRYRIVKINNSNLEFEEVSSGRHGQKAIEDQGPNA